MEILFKISLLYLCLQATVCSEITYKAGIASGDIRNGVKDYVSQINRAAKQNADIVLLSSNVTDPDTLTHSKCDSSNYDQLLRDISGLAKTSGVYIVTHLYEKVRCQNGEELVRNNIAFDRQGSLVAINSKPVSSVTRCNGTTSKMAALTTDFGVKFLILAEEDILLQDLNSLGAKNLIVTGGSYAESDYLRGSRISQSLAYALEANVISEHGIYSSKSGLITNNGLVTEINKNREGRSNNIYFLPITEPELPDEELGQNTMVPLDLEMSVNGLKKSVCHDGFCCEFYVKTSLDNSVEGIQYEMSVFMGYRQIGEMSIGVQTCEIVACRETSRRSCLLQLQNNNSVTFEKLSIKGNFTRQHSFQLPVILTTQTSMSSDSFKFLTKTVNDVREVSMELSNVKNIFKFGILGRDYTKDYVDNFNSNHTNVKSHDVVDFYEYIFNDDVIDFFDYLWIRIRVLLLIVSLYILEMM
ncbi:vanin-like protein 3 [Battus philenor]|uniref:vanin-like protein 3 n=1 Tax=Battus philenor TaxID=42288 RepID=UPI0035D05C92